MDVSENEVYLVAGTIAAGMCGVPAMAGDACNLSEEQRERVADQSVDLALKVRAKLRAWVEDDARRHGRAFSS